MTLPNVESDIDELLREDDDEIQKGTTIPNKRPLAEAWPFHNVQKRIETVDTRDHSTPSSAMTQTPPPESSTDNWQSWDQNAGAYYVPVMFSPYMPDQHFPSPTGMGTQQGQTPGFSCSPAAGAVNPSPEWGDATTVMMRNLPNKYTQRSLLIDINEAGFIGTFDFLYLPIDTETNANKGYAFINFAEPGFAWMFKQGYEGKKMPRFNSDKVVSVSAATLQGFDANYAHYANSRVNRGDPANRPLFLREPSPNLAPKPGWRGGKRNGRPQNNNSNLDQLAETEDLHRRLESAVQAIVTKQQPREEQQPEQQLMRFCPQCGHKANSDFKFCPGCGSSLTLS